MTEQETERGKQIAKECIAAMTEQQQIADGKRIVAGAGVMSWGSTSISGCTVNLVDREDLDHVVTYARSMEDQLKLKASIAIEPSIKRGEELVANPPTEAHWWTGSHNDLVEYAKSLEAERDRLRLDKTDERTRKETK
jgi:hypothetical protein